MVPERRRWPRWLRVLIGALFAWAIGLLLLLINFFPHTPSTRGGWMLFLLAGPPAYFAADWAGTALFTAGKGARASAARKAAAVLALLAAGAILWWSLRGAARA